MCHLASILWRLDGHPPQASGGAFYRVSAVQSPGIRLNWQQGHFRCDGRWISVSWCSAGQLQLQLQRHREAHLFVQWVRDDDWNYLPLSLLVYRDIRGCLLVFMVVLGVASSARPASRLSPHSEQLTLSTLSTCLLPHPYKIQTLCWSAKLLRFAMFGLKILTRRW